MTAQGYKNVKGILYQDNMSAIRVEKNAQISMGRNTKHMEIRYFYVKDRVTGNNMEIRYCPTEEMIAGFLTKPLQGELFRKFRAVLMGHVHLREALHRTDTCQERVEEKEKDLEKIKEMTKKIQMREVPAKFRSLETFSNDSRIQKGDNNNHRIKKDYASVVKEGL